MEKHSTPIRRSLITAASQARPRLALMEALEDRRLLSVGALDPVFGKVHTDINNSIDSGYGVAIQQDGKVIVVGPTIRAGQSSDFALVRYNTNGTLDTTFGSNGKVITDFAGRNDTPYAVVLQDDGKILVAGSSAATGNTDIIIARYNSDGTLDTGFGTGGFVLTDLGGNDDQALAMALMSDGRIVVAGATVEHGGHDQQFVVARYSNSGALDATFGGTGVVTTNFDIGSDIAYGVAVLDDGRIVAAGVASFDFEINQGIPVPSDTDIAVVRYNADGSLDTTFGGTGKVLTDISGGFDEGRALTLQADGKVVVAGSAVAGGIKHMAVVRYNTNGSLDTTFSGDGKATLNFGMRNDVAFAVAMQDDKIVLAGSTSSVDAGQPHDVNFAIARLNSNGSLDTSFGKDGKRALDLNRGRDTASAIAIDSSGNIVVAGSASPDQSVIGNFAVARLLGSDLPQSAPVYILGPHAGSAPHVRVLRASDQQEVASFFAFDPGFLGGITVAVGDVNGDGVPDYIVGAGPGGSTNIRVFDGYRTQITGTPQQMAGPLGSFLAFPGVGGDPADPNSNFYRLAFQGGVNLAVGDINGDGIDDIIVSVEAGGNPHVKVFSGVNGAVIRSFLAYPGVGGDPADPNSVYYTQAFMGGVRLGVGDINGDGRDDILTAAGPGAGPHVKVFDGTYSRREIRSYWAYDQAYRGGVRIAAGDWNGDGFADVMTAAGTNVAPHVKVIDGKTSIELASFYAYEQSFLGSVRIISGDVNGDGFDDLITVPGAGRAQQVRVFPGNGGYAPTPIQSFFAWSDTNYTGGTNIGFGRA